MRLIRRLFKRDYFVIADSKDNSITFSKDLFHSFKIKDKAKIMVVNVGTRENVRYAMVLNPETGVDNAAQFDIQYNERHKCIGFECLVPTVNRIFYDYLLPAYTQCKLSVERKKTVNGTPYYEILKPLANK